MYPCHRLKILRLNYLFTTSVGFKYILESFNLCSIHHYENYQSLNQRYRVTQCSYSTTISDSFVQALILHASEESLEQHVSKKKIIFSARKYYLFSMTFLEIINLLFLDQF